MDIHIGNGAAELLLAEVLALRTSIAEAAEATVAGFALSKGEESEAINNLCHYLALRRHDIRALQRQLMWHGLSSLGRAEGRVLPAFDAVLAALAALSGKPGPFVAPSEATFFSGEAMLTTASDALFGAPPHHRRVVSPDVV